MKDDEPVYQRARRLSMSEGESVNKQIDQWIQDRLVINFGICESDCSHQEKRWFH